MQNANVACDTGVCGHQWCYLCLSAWTQDQFNIPFCEHQPQCPERSANPFRWRGLDELDEWPLGLDGAGPERAADVPREVPRPRVLRPRVHPHDLPTRFFLGPLPGRRSPSPLPELADLERRLTRTHSATYDPSLAPYLPTPRPRRHHPFAPRPEFGWAPPPAPGLPALGNWDVGTERRRGEYYLGQRPDITEQEPPSESARRWVVRHAPSSSSKTRRPQIRVPGPTSKQLVRMWTA